MTTHNGVYSYDGAGRLVQVVDSATGLTELYTWNNDGTLASAPGSGYTKQFAYDEESRLTSISHDAALVYQYAYGADGGRRWRKDIAASLWTWYPCGVACSAGELVEQTSDLTGAVWSTAALYLRGGSGCSARIIRRNSEYHHADIPGAFPVITNGSGSVLSSSLNDQNGVQRFVNGSAATPWRWNQAGEEGLVRINGSDYLPERGLLFQKSIGAPPAQARRNCAADRQICANGVTIGASLCAAAVGVLSVACFAVCAALPDPTFITKVACINLCTNLTIARLAVCAAAAAAGLAICQIAYGKCVHNGGTP